MNRKEVDVGPLSSLSDGFLHCLEDGLHSLDSRPDLTMRTERFGAPFAAEILSSDNPPLAIDIRTPREREQEHIAGSLSVPLNNLAENLENLPKNRPLLVYWAGGYRSSIAASILQSRGFGDVSEIASGIAGWEAAKLPVQTTRDIR
jgi:rhodanese-related sulfurtransferase